MRHGIDGWSIRSRIVALILAILLPTAVTLAWFLAADVRQARDAARERVRLLAVTSANELQRHLGDTERVLSLLAARPAVKAMNAGACEPTMAEYPLLSPGFSALSVHDLQGRRVCGHPDAAWPEPVDDAVAPADAEPAEGLTVGPVKVLAATGERVMALSHPIRDEHGRRLGQLVLTVNLMALNRHLLPPTPGHAVVTVVDPSRTVLLRSDEPGSYIGHRPRPDETDPAVGAREGFVEAVGRDGVARLFAFVTLPKVDWRVAGSLPMADVLHEYRGTRRRTLAIGAGLLLLALALGWRLSAAIVQPVADLRRTAEQVAAGDATVRSPVSGPPEVQALALNFNRMLEERLLVESRLRGIFASALDGIISCDESQHIVEANLAAARMFHCGIDDLVGSPLERFIPARFRQAHARELRHFGEEDLVSRRMAAQREVLALRADGEEFPIEASISQLTVNGQRLYTVIHRDITERRRAETALRDSEARQRRLLAHLPEAVLVSAGNRIAFVNPSACQLLGADADALLGRSLLSFIHADSLQRMSAQLGETGSLAPMAETTIVRTDGALRQVEALVTPVEYDGGHAALIVLRDVSELRRAQAELSASHADLTRLVAELDTIQEAERKRMARELHDDLQQTLAAIRMDVAAAGLAFNGEHSAIRASLANIDRLAVSALSSTRRIINDLRPQLLEDCGLAAALEIMASQFEHRYGVTCSLLVNDRALEHAPTSPDIATCLYRVAQEALNNVAKHADASHVKLDLQRIGSDRLRLVVADDGQGFTESDLRKPQSFGLLGLKERVRAQHGTVQVDCVAGVGTTLTVEVPLAAG